MEKEDVTNALRCLARPDTKTLEKCRACPYFLYGIMCNTVKIARDTLYFLEQENKE